MKCKYCFGELNTGFICMSCGKDNQPGRGNSNADGNSRQVELQVMQPLLNKVEKNRYDTFKSKHIHSNKFNLAINETGIATAYKIECLKCKATENITDYNSW